MRVDVIEATGLVLVEFRRPRGTYRVGDTGGVPPADVVAGIDEGVFFLAPVPDGVATTKRDLDLRPSTSGHVVTPAATATSGGGGTASARSDVEIPAGWEKLHHLPLSARAGNHRRAAPHRD